MGRVSDAKERLLTAAIELIWEQSYGAVTVDAICEHAQVKKGSFYHFFTSKAELAVAALEAHWQNAKPDLDRIFSPLTPPLERIKNYFDYTYRRQVEEKERCGRVLGCFYSCLGCELVHNEEIICNKARESLSHHCKYFESALRDAAAEGSIPTQNVATSAKSLFSFWGGVLLQARIQNDPEPIRTAKKVAMQMIGAKSVA